MAGIVNKVNYADGGECYLPGLKAEVINILRDYTIESMVCCSHLPCMVSGEELAGKLEPIREGEIFCMNNNVS